MKRNLDLMRSILLRIEKHHSAWVQIATRYDGWIADEECYFWEVLRGSNGDEIFTDHIERVPMTADEKASIDLLADAGFLTFSEDSSNPNLTPDEISEKYVRITNAGHDYLDAVRNEGIWKRTKGAVIEQGGNATLEIVKALATGFLRKQIEERTGIKL